MSRGYLYAAMNDGVSLMETGSVESISCYFPSYIY